MNTLPKVSLPLAAAAMLVFGGCSRDAAETLAGPISQTTRFEVEAISETSFSATVGTVASPAPTIRVSDVTTHAPLANVPVFFRIESGDGSVEGASVVTDAGGRASPGAWSLGTKVGTTRLTVSVNGTLSLTFTAQLKADVPARLVALTQTDRAALLGATVEGPRAEVQDRFSNPVPGAAVLFAVADGGGTLERSSAATGDGGIATAGGWKISSTAGHNIATARLPGLDSIAFSVEALDPSTIKWYRLETVRTASGAFTPLDFGVDSARFGMTGFDPCLCKKQDGYFIGEVQYNQYSDYGSVLVSESGRYQLIGAVLSISSLPHQGSVQNGELILDRSDSDFTFLFAWIYEEMKGGSQ